MSDGAAADSVEGVVERVLFRSEDDAFAVVLVRVDGRDALVKAAGALAEAGEGEVWRLAGAVEEHPRYGERLVVTTAYPVTPGSVAGLERYLGGGRFPGVGRKVAETLVAQFGSKTFDVLASADKLKIPGLGRKKLAALRAAVREDRMRCETLAFLSGLGFGPSTAGRVFQRFGDRTVAQVREDPYVLADEVRGVGFTLADQAASALGVRGDHPSRLRAGVLHVLKQAAEQGHVAVPVDAATPRAARLLDVDVDLCADALRRAEADRRLVIDDAGGDVAYAYLPFLHAAETEAALAVKRLAERPALLAPDAPAPVEPPAMLSEEQRAAVDLLLRRPLALLTGGPGVGKTTVLRAFVDAAVAAGAKVELAAPTGRAARRLEETVGRPARTLHRMLGLLPSDAGLGR
ncbi:MAG TPA: ATP-dependent RecD-like DNA helicase, partial [Planctomycetota bacterium]|nr:ATP-dependent RecD-like DNA helicase [Planctomycetota bacterium]